jgi:hypothetical protein
MPHVTHWLGRHQVNKTERCGPLQFSNSRLPSSRSPVHCGMITGWYAPRGQPAGSASGPAVGESIRLFVVAKSSIANPVCYLAGKSGQPILREGTNSNPDGNHGAVLAHAELSMWRRALGNIRSITGRCCGFQLPVAGLAAKRHDRSLIRPAPRRSKQEMITLLFQVATVLQRCSGQPKRWRAEEVGGVRKR